MNVEGSRKRVTNVQNGLTNVVCYGKIIRIIETYTEGGRA